VIQQWIVFSWWNYHVCTYIKMSYVSL